MPTVLLLGARAPVACDIARSLAAAGARVVAADAWRWPPARWSRAVARTVRLPAPRAGAWAFASAVADLVRTECADAVVPLCEEGFWLAAVIAARPGLLPPGCRLVAPAADAVARIHDKAAFAETALRHGLAVPSTHRLASADEVEAVLADGPAGRWVFKPVWSRFATAALIGASADVVRRRVRPTAAAPWVAQARVHGRGLCTYSIVRDGEVIAHSACWPDIVYSRAAVVLEAIEHAAAEAWVRRLCGAERLTGQVSFDFIEGDVDGGNNGDTTLGELRDASVGLYAVECNPRATSGANLWQGDPSLGTAILAAAGLAPTPSDVVRPVIGAVTAIKSAVWLGLPGWSGDSDRRRIALTALASGRDAFARRGDVRPAIAQPLALVECVARAVRHGIGVADAMTVDMRWDGEAVTGPVGKGGGKGVDADEWTDGRADFDTVGAA
ncbi:MAG: hypothetical protein IPG72_03040 [Ardenticatenales bacterium]|nr:hypothetical protein [Ardenticatenales bacterium]